VIGAAGYISTLTVLPAPEAPRDPGDKALANDLDFTVGVGLLDFELLCSAQAHAITVIQL
jgi:hypothetical protein